MPAIDWENIDSVNERAEDDVSKAYADGRAEQYADDLAQIDAMQDDIDRLKAERDAAFAMSKCECETNECCANLVRNDAEIDRMRKDAERYRWLRNEADYVRLKEGSPQVCLTDEWGEIISLQPSAYLMGERLDAAIDAFISQSLSEEAKGTI